MKILVTGSSGFIGSYTCLNLQSRGHEVLSFDRIGQSNKDVFLGDIRDGNSVTEAMAHVDGWIHLAGVLGTQETIKNPFVAAETNILGGLNMLEAAAQYKLPGVYIAVGNHLMDNTYSITKTTTERFCRMYRDERDVNVSIVRAYNAYGPGQSIASPFGPSKVRKIIPAFVCRAMTGRPIEIYGSGDQIMDMIYVADVANILVSTLMTAISDGFFKKVIQAGTGRSTTVLEIAGVVADTVKRHCGVESSIKFLPMRPGELENSVVLADDPTNDMPGINKSDLVTLEDGLERTIEYYKEHWLPTWKG